MKLAKERRIGFVALAGLEAIHRDGRQWYRLVPGSALLPGQGDVHDVRLSPEVQRRLEQMAGFYRISAEEMLALTIPVGVELIVNGWEQP